MARKMVLAAALAVACCLSAAALLASQAAPHDVRGGADGFATMMKETCNSIQGGWDCTIAANAGKECHICLKNRAVAATQAQKTGFKADNGVQVFCLNKFTGACNAQTKTCGMPNNNGNCVNGTGIVSTQPAMPTPDDPTDPNNPPGP